MIQKSKLKSRRGASITLALLIFMLCALAGASAFMMAASNAGRYSHSEEQDYYSVSSAALLVVDLLNGLTYSSDTVTYDYERNWNYSKDEAGNSKHTTTDGYTLGTSTKDTEGTSSGSSLSVEGKLTGGDEGFRGNEKVKVCDTIKSQCDKLVPFLNVPNEWYESVKNNEEAHPSKPTSVPSVTYEFTVDVQKADGTDDSRYDTVNCKLVMNANYDLIFTFDSGNGAYSITAYWVADVKANITSSAPVYSYADDTSKEGDSYVRGSMTIKRTMNVNVTYNKSNVTISRGDASGIVQEEENEANS